MTYLIGGMVADWLEQSACNAESTDSSLVRDSYRVGTLSKFFAHNCSAILTASVPPGRRVSALLNLSVRRAISKLRTCIVLINGRFSVVELKIQVWERPLGRVEMFLGNVYRQWQMV